MSNKKSNVEKTYDASSATGVATTVILQAPKGGKSTNYLPWVESSVDNLGPKFGNLASVLKTHVAYVVPPVTPADYLPPEDLPGANAEQNGDVGLTEANRRELKLRAMSARMAEIKELNKEKPKFYNSLWATLSAESRQLIAAHADYEQTFQREDPNALLRIIRFTHFTDVNGGGLATQVLENLLMKQQEFAMLRQSAGQTVAMFKREFDEFTQILVNMGAEPFTEPQKAMHFLLKLDPARHGLMMVELKNQAARGTAYPDTLKKAYTLASNWQSAVYDGHSNTSSNSMHSVFVLSDTVDKTKKKPGKGSGGNVRTNNGNNSRNNGKSEKKKEVSHADKQKDSAPYTESRRCHLCKQRGHLIDDCEENPRSANYKQGKTSNVMLAIGDVDSADDDDDIDVEDGVNLVCHDCSPIPLVASVTEDEDYDVDETIYREYSFIFSDNEVVLDSAAARSVFKSPSLLHNIHQLTRTRRIGGVNKKSPALVIDQEGEWGDYGPVGLTGNSITNILSQAEQVDRGNRLEYDSATDKYSLTSPSETKVFNRKLLSNGDKSPFYTCHVFAGTVQDNMRRYTTREVKQATNAVELQRRLGHMSNTAAIKVINSGGIVNCDITSADVRNAKEIFGPSAASLKGKTKTHRPAIVTPILAPRVTQVQQVLHVDILFVKEIPFLIGVLSPLGLVHCAHLKDRSTICVNKALSSFINRTKSRNFDIQVIRVDGEGSLFAMRDGLNAEGIVVSVAGPGEHVPVVERMIQTVKSRVRAQENSLPYVMTRQLLVYCVLFSVRCVNLQPSSTSTDNVSPHEQFTGRKLDAKIDLRCGFGDYVQARVPVTDNSMEPRTQGCITLLPTGNSSGSVLMLSLRTASVVTRDQFQILPMPDQIIDHITELAKKEGYSRGADPTIELPDTVTDDDAEESSSVTPPPLPDMMPIDIQQPSFPTTTRNNAEMMPVVGVNNNDLHEVPATEPIHIPEPFAVRRSARLASARQPGPLSFALVGSKLQDSIRKQILKRSNWHDAEFAFTMSVRAAMRERPTEARPVIFAELRQMLEKGVWHGVKTASLNKEERKAIIRSSMFLKDKYLASGAFEKFKARLVAGGDQQDRQLYDNVSSPTAATSSVLSVAAIAASECREVVTIDIGGAFLNADMPLTGVKVRMRLDKLMSSMLVELDPRYKEYLEPGGTIVVELDKALYGCVEAASLWFKHLCRTLKRYGLVQNPYDSCVFNKDVKVGGNRIVQMTIVLHVDDLMVTCTSRTALDDFRRYLDGVYPETKTHQGKVLDYIGMTFDFSNIGEVRITMKNCVDDIIAGCGVTKTRTTPAASTLFDIRDAPKVTPEEAKYFHTHVAKILYLAKRVRPECLTAVSFLTTRVQTCDIDDLAKLKRVLGYIIGTRERGIVLRIGDQMTVRAYIDAAYGVHSDSGKSHTGSMIVLGDGGPVQARSTKQKIVTKSSTEAELVGMSDSASQAIHLRNFIQAQGYETGPVIIYQDNLSCMALMKRGGPGSERSRHINIRHFWLKERETAGEVVFEHLGTENMPANSLTKPVQGAQFYREREGLTNWR